jgi:hypothetical protein
VPHELVVASDDALVVIAQPNYLARRTPRLVYLFAGNCLEPADKPAQLFFSSFDASRAVHEPPLEFLHYSAFYGTQLAVFNYFSQYDHERTAMRLARRIQQLGYQVEIHKAA